MKYFVICSILSFFNGSGHAQNIKVDQSGAIVLKTIGSPPSPRLGDRFTVGLDLGDLRNGLFNAYNARDSGKVIRHDFREPIPIFSIDVLSIGTHEIKPIQFTLGDLRFTTTKLVYQVEDSLPARTDGLWIRKSITGDSTFCITIEQRIAVDNPDNKSAFELSKNGMSSCSEMVMIQLTDEQFEVLDYTMSTNGCTLDKLIIDNATRYYYSYYSFTCFTIKRKDRSIMLSKEDFMNLPADYKFEPIVIRK